jgi:pimeloyl-ACP methyl ester carboxylesterase
MRTRPIRAGIAAAVTIVVAAGVPAAAQPPVAGRPALAWGGCPADLPVHPDQRCAAVRVPVDYRQPHGRHITVTVSRIPATDPSRRLGTLVLSPGGPGVGGLGMPADFHGPDQPPQLRQRYDLVGFDPRGVRHSTPVSCGLPVRDRDVRYPRPDGSIGHSVTYAQRAAAACRHHIGDLLPHITTSNTARDLDRIRAALGEPRISYLGLSYGSYLGAVYASRYPHRTDRFVLDSALDPDRIWYEFIRLGALGLHQRLSDLSVWIAARTDVYHLGGTATQVRDRYRSLTRQLDATPLEFPGATVDGNWLRDFTRDNLERPDAAPFETLATVWQELAAAVTAPVGKRSPTGSARAAAGTGIGTRPAPRTAVAADNAQAVGFAVQCGDARWPRNVSTYHAAVQADRSHFPDDAGRSANITPCAFWPAPAEARPHVGGHGPRNILILQNRHDPATPWVSGHAMHRALGNRSALVTADAGGHLVTGRNPCATAITLRYLVDTETGLPDTQICPPGPAIRRS